MEGEADSIPAEIPAPVLSEMTATWSTLTKSRKKRAVQPDQETPEGLSGWPSEAAASHTLHKTNPAGITCLALSGALPELSLTGGVDKTAVLFNHAEGTQAAVLTGHSKKVLDVGFTIDGALLLTASADGTGKVRISLCDL